MNAVIPGVVVGTVFLALAIWIELREDLAPFRFSKSLTTA